MRAEQVAAFVDRRLIGAERVSVEAHLADCAECRAELVDVQRIVTGTQRRELRSVLVGGVAIAATAMLVVSIAHRAPAPAADRLLRGSGAATLAAIAPHGAVHRSDLALVWAVAGDRATYRITVTDAAGKPVWSSDGRDTSVVIPATVDLSTNADYFWTVDAFLPDGRSRTTTAQSFRIDR